MKKLGIGDNPKEKAPIEDGLAMREKFDGKEKLVDNAGNSQRPVRKSGDTVMSDRGTFPVK